MHFFLELYIDSYKYKQIISNLAYLLITTPSQAFCLFALPHTNCAFGIVPYYYYSIEELLKGEGGEGGWKSYHTSLGCLYHTFIFEEEEDGEIPIHSLHLCYCGSVHVLSLKVSIKVSIVCEEN